MSLHTSQTGFRIVLSDCFVVLSGVILATSILEKLFYGTGLQPLVQVVYLCMYAVAMMLAFSSGALFMAVRHSPLIIALVVLPPISMLWSTNPGETLQRSIGLVGTCTLAIFIGMHYDRRKMIQLIALGFTGSTLLSFASIIAIPSIGIDQTQAWAGAWVGFHLHKNALGATASAAALVTLYAMSISHGKLRLLFAFDCLISIVLVVGSQVVDIPRGDIDRLLVGCLFQIVPTFTPTGRAYRFCRTLHCADRLVCEY